MRSENVLNIRFCNEREVKSREMMFLIYKSTFLQKLDEFRSPHIWRKIKNNWYLKHTVNQDGVDD